MSFERSQLKFKIDEESLLVNPDLHDAEVIEITAAHLEDQEVICKLKTERGDLFELQFIGVKAFSCQDLYSHNVVREVMFWTSKDLQSQLSNYRGELGLMDEGQYRAVIDSAQSKKSYLVHFVPSVGATIVILCETVVIYKAT
jgi:hypothetical protein